MAYFRNLNSDEIWTTLFKITASSITTLMNSLEPIKIKHTEKMKHVEGGFLYSGFSLKEDNSINSFIYHTISY